jgi:hypothetical protein
MSPLAQATRFLDERGEAMTVREFTAGTKNAYGDAAKVPVDRAVQGIFELVGSPTMVRAATGREVRVDAKAYVADGEEPAESADDASQPLLIAGGLEYLVVRVSPDQNGIRTLFCEARR